MMNKEIILCAAIWYKDFPPALYQPKNIDKGVVLCGHRHTGIIHQHVILLGKKQSEMGKYEQGFITNTNRFVNREEAAIIAFLSSQINEPKKQLFSEDLY